MRELEKGWSVDLLAKGADKSLVDKWLNHPDHGAKHSASVYRGCLTLAVSEGIEVDEKLDRKFQALSVMHDMMRLTGTSWRRHAGRAGAAVRKWGQEWGFTREETIQMAADLQYHDLSYDLNMPETERKRLLARMSDEGKIFHDADKLFAVTDGSDWVEDAWQVVGRNKTGSFQAKDGWYLLRQEISNQKRDQFKYGARWWLDRLAALRADFFISMDLLTDSGKGLAQKRKQALWNNLADIFGEEFDDHADRSKDMDREQLGVLVKQALETVLNETDKNAYGTQPKGKMVEVDGQLFDPTILQFVLEENNGREKFIDAIKLVLQGGMQ